MKTLLAIVILICTFSAMLIAVDYSKPLANKVIVLDPGHGGIYSGAVHNNVREADVNLAVALKLRDRLVKSGAKVILTRTADTNLAPVGSSLTADLQARVDVAKNSGADIFISLHANVASDTNTTGSTSYYPTEQASNLALAIQTSIVKKTGTFDNGIRPANFYVLIRNNVPAALIEMGFLTNPNEAARLVDDTYQNQLAESICSGVISYFNSNSKINLNDKQAS
jgi:N-acetylmuramoyl-L-alanine amidase